MPFRRVWFAVCFATALSTTVVGCTKRQLVPGLIAGTGAAMVTAGAAYRASLDTDRPFGETDGQIAGTTALLFGGLGLLITGVVWSLTSTHCDEDHHCWPKDRCHRSSHTCVRRPSPDEVAGTTAESTEADPTESAEAGEAAATTESATSSAPDEAEQGAAGDEPTPLPPAQ